MYATNEFFAKTPMTYLDSKTKGKIMADKENRLPQNVPGSYYVDSSCIDCDRCRATAPALFKRDDDIGFSFVHRQPTTPEELTLAKEALEECPTASIGND